MRTGGAIGLFDDCNVWGIFSRLGKEREGNVHASEVVNITASNDFTRWHWLRTLDEIITNERDSWVSVERSFDEIHPEIRDYWHM